MTDASASRPCARCGGSRGRDPRKSTLLCPDCRFVMSPAERDAFLGKTPPVSVDVADLDEGVDEREEVEAA